MGTFSVLTPSRRSARRYGQAHVTRFENLEKYFVSTPLEFRGTYHLPVTWLVQVRTSNFEVSAGSV